MWKIVGTYLYRKRSAVVGAFRGGLLNDGRDVVYGGMVFTLIKPVRVYISIALTRWGAALCGAADMTGSVSTVKI